MIPEKTRGMTQSKRYIMGIFRKYPRNDLFPYLASNYSTLGPFLTVIFANKYINWKERFVWVNGWHVQHIFIINSTRSAPPFVKQPAISPGIYVRTYSTTLHTLQSKGSQNSNKVLYTREANNIDDYIFRNRYPF
jgi:hypothetical protein